MKNGRTVLTVTQLTNLIRLRLETEFPQVWVLGEISNFKHHTSGHMYFTLKDENAQLACVLWRSRAASLLVTPEDGVKVIARGALTVYPPRGNYQLDVVQIQPLGIGELQMEFERLKKKLAAEGLFDADRKKPLPQYPERIGVITSETGAALQDILSVLSRRFPSVEVVLLPVRVQGAGAAEDIALAVKAMNEFGQVDVIILGRGGGSLEDLWAFNEEVVARAIAASKIPVISAVGHEVDFSIADFVADLRAPTPSAAAELVVPDRDELLELLAKFTYTMRRSVEEYIRQLRERVAGLLSSYSFNRPKDLVRQSAQRVDELERSLTVAFSHVRRRAADRLLSLHQRLESLGPARVLRRGYAIVRKDRRVVSTATALQEGDRAILEFHDGEVPARVEFS